MGCLRLCSDQSSLKTTPIANFGNIGQICLKLGRDFQLRITKRFVLNKRWLFNTTTKSYLQKENLNTKEENDDATADVGNYGEPLKETASEIVTDIINNNVVGSQAVIEALRTGKIKTTPAIKASTKAYRNVKKKTSTPLLSKPSTSRVRPSLVTDDEGEFHSFSEEEEEGGERRRKITRDDDDFPSSPSLVEKGSFLVNRPSNSSTPRRNSTFETLVKSFGSAKKVTSPSPSPSPLKKATSPSRSRSSWSCHTLFPL